MIRTMFFIKLLSLLMALPPVIIFAQSLSPLSGTQSQNLPAESDDFQASNDGTLTVGIGGSFRIFKDAFLTTTNEINNLGTGANFVVETNANLLQINEAAVNSGNITVERRVTDINNDLATQMDYIYWSSPVLGQKTKGAGGFSPGTPSNRFYSYRESNDLFYETPDAQFVPGKGYAVRAETGLNPVTAQNYINGYDKTYKFQGTPNNGLVTVPVKRSPNTGANGNIIHGYNLIGNPYPSNINFDQFYDINSRVIYPTVWLWTNNSYTPGQQAQGYNQNNYAVYNRTGGAAATGSASGGGMLLKPDGLISVGQGFIVQARDLGDASVNFQHKFGRRDLRIAAPANFYSRETLVKDRFWLHLISPDNLVNSLLIGYIAGASNGFEVEYDAELLAFSSDVFYSILGDKNLQIQGRDPFTTEDKVILGANFFKDAAYTISLEETEGIFATSQPVYLKDKETGRIINLSQGNYTFEASKGVSSGRFEIIYKPETVLGTGDIGLEDILVYRESGDFVVRSKSGKITDLEVYEASGRLVYKVHPQNTKAVIAADRLTQGMYILKIMQNGKITSKKILK